MNARILGFNATALALYYILLFGMYHNTRDQLAFLIFLAMAMVIHLLVVASLSVYHYSKGNRETGGTYLLSFALVLLIGFSLCTLST
jgi:phosphatidylserine synthase